MESGLITSWNIDGEKVETVADFIFLGSKIIAYFDCSHEIKRCLLFESINFSVLSLIYGPTLTSIHDYWKNHSFDYTRLLSTK